jgi:hypothetical protein
MRLPGGQRQFHRHVAFFGPTRPPLRLIMQHQLQLQRRQIGLLEQRSDLGLLGLPDELPVGADEGSDGGIGEHLVFMRLPA